MLLTVYLMQLSRLYLFYVLLGQCHDRRSTRSQRRGWTKQQRREQVGRAQSHDLRRVEKAAGDERKALAHH